jgi:hypothetical protein
VQNKHYKVHIAITVLAETPTIARTLASMYAKRLPGVTSPTVGSPRKLITRHRR